MMFHLKNYGTDAFFLVKESQQMYLDDNDFLSHLLSHLTMNTSVSGVVDSSLIGRTIKSCKAWTHCDLKEMKSQIM